jgi:hypothetical protein
MRESDAPAGSIRALGHLHLVEGRITFAGG